MTTRPASDDTTIGWVLVLLAVAAAAAAVWHAGDAEQSWEFGPDPEKKPKDPHTGNALPFPGTGTKLDELEPAFRRELAAVMDELRADGWDPVLVSAHRTLEEQAISLAASASRPWTL